jgi:hypothetical protein
MAVTCIANQQDLQNNSTSFTFRVTASVVVNMTPEDIADSLEEKLRELCEVRNRNLSETPSIEQHQLTTWSNDVVDEDIDSQMLSDMNQLYDDVVGSLLVRHFDV